MLERELGSLRDVPILVLGLTYREGVHELAYSRAIPLIERLAAAGAHVSGWDPLLTPEEIAGCGAEPWAWGSSSLARAIVLQTADKAFRAIDLAWWPDLEVILDGRNGLPDVKVPESVRVLGIGVPPRGEVTTAGRRLSGPSSGGAWQTVCCGGAPEWPAAGWKAIQVSATLDGPGDRQARGAQVDSDRSRAAWVAMRDRPEPEPGPLVRARR